jgi:hypothetical protein
VCCATFAVLNGKFKQEWKIMLTLVLAVVLAAIVPGGGHTVIVGGVG